MAMIGLANLEASMKFGRLLANTILNNAPLPIFMSGELGAGKTTIAGYFVNSLPGAENAIVSSPSFNIYNRYPTLPEIWHCDLYRCKENIPEEIEDAIFSPDILVLLEWANFLPANLKPTNFLDINLAVRNNARSMQLNATGTRAQQIKNELCKILTNADDPAIIVTDQ